MMRKNKKKELQRELSRRACMKKFAKYTAVTALGTFVLLSPKKAQASSPATPGGGF